MYEAVPGNLLFDYPTPLLIEALTSSRPSEAQWRGAARHFGGWEFAQKKKKDRSLLSPIFASACSKPRALPASRTPSIAQSWRSKSDKLFGAPIRQRSPSSFQRRFKTACVAPVGAFTCAPIFYQAYTPSAIH